jgi:hypothetical protein
VQGQHIRPGDDEFVQAAANPCKRRQIRLGTGAFPCGEWGGGMVPNKSFSNFLPFFETFLRSSDSFAPGLVSDLVNVCLEVSPNLCFLFDL